MYATARSVLTKSRKFMKTLSVGPTMPPKADQISELLVSYLANHWASRLKDPEPREELQSLITSQIACFLAMRWLASRTEQLCQKIRVESEELEELSNAMSNLQYGLASERINEMLSDSESVLKTLTLEES